ncbi:MAG: ubiquitinyl hydrolase 1 [Pycnora praestabilis]|nr:MAG: ubiquitinyl hydrolase 1 [Pycnora praestabilis]
MTEQAAQHILAEDPGKPAKPKAFVPLENNPEVMSQLIHRLGVSSALAFHDIFSIDDPDLLAFVPRPAYALLLVFPVSKAYEKFRHEEDANKQEYKESGPQEEVIWFKQTIRNACGMIGVLHGVSNGDARDFIEPSSNLSALLEAATPLQPAARADLLYDSQALESAHQSAASQGHTTVPGAEDDIDLHYVCFIKSKDNNLWELDGSRKGPLNRGPLGLEEDVLSDKALDMGVKSFLKREEAVGGGELRFSLIALGPSVD